MGKRVVWLLMLMVWTLAIEAQKETVSGTVVSSADGQRIAGASVTADGTGPTVVTNGDGFFTLKSDSLPRTVTVSHLGYRTERITLEGRTAPLTIRLHPTAIQLSEVLVVADNPRALVAAAISRITQNYSPEPERYRCFYRETAMKRQHYISVAEGVVDMYKTPYSRRSVGRDKVAISKGRRLLSPKQSDTLSVKVMGGPVGAVMLDIVKNRDFLLNEADLDCYQLTMDVPQSIDDRPQYVVRIAPQREMDWPLYYGRLYIDQQTLAFSRAELSLDMSDRSKATRQMLVKKPAGVRFRPKELSLLVDYRYDGTLTRISYMRSTFRFNCDWRRRLFATAFTATCEMVVTNHEGGSDVQPITGRESFDSRDAFFDKVAYFRDPTFWQDYNIIEPTVSLDKAIGRIIKKY